MDDDDFLRAHEPPLSSDSSEFTEYDLNINQTFGQMEPDDAELDRMLAEIDAEQARRAQGNDDD